MADPTLVTTEVRDTTTAALAVRSDARRRTGRLSPRAAFLLRRIGRLAIALIVVVVASFFLIHLIPGDPVRAVLGPDATPELVAATRSELGLDKPLGMQFVDYVGGLLRGDFGVSIRTHRPVADILAQRFPVTLTLGAVSFIVAVLGALPVGIAAAVWSRSGRRRAGSMGLSAILGVLIAVPDFLLGVGFVALFAVTLGWLPAAGWGDLSQAVLPVLALSLGPMAYLARIVQVEMVAVLGMTYMTTARSKRLPARLIHLRHALPNIVTASLTVGGLVLAGLTAGTVLIETVFAVPGMGTTLVSAVSAKDYPVVQGAVIVYALIVLGVNLVVDIILVTIDPRSSITEG
ncbi:ABC transporter permease [Microbacterium horticulturae]|uniref:ABC transporter permease n=1 Tax=Microbacterium horticulturae TaxID=3028316 RepID=A0ABY8BWX9_9MICO|nr:ABC transporter permease [Microbacterium sp. KACC 23027]WEG08695.1 ABC transporter permease [Microbacterium sp. KACC 23027]